MALHSSLTTCVSSLFKRKMLTIAELQPSCLVSAVLGRGKGHTIEASSWPSSPTPPTPLPTPIPLPPFPEGEGKASLCPEGGTACIAHLGGKGGGPSWGGQGSCTGLGVGKKGEEVTRRCGGNTERWQVVVFLLVPELWTVSFEERVI